MNRVLPNNLKPATHFIEVIKFGNHTINDVCNEIKDLELQLSETKFIGLKTIAIFKIRLKPQ